MQLTDKEISEMRPMRVVNPRPSYSNEGSTAAALSKQEGTTPPAPQVVVAGPRLDKAAPGRMQDQIYAVGDEATLLEKTKHVRGKKETMNEFFARVGLGKAQILAMSKDEIAHFVEVVSQHEQVPAPRYIPVAQEIERMERLHTGRVIAFVG